MAQRHNGSVPRRSHRPVPGQKELRERLGRRIRELRTARELSQAALGSPHFDRQYVSGVELGAIAPSLSALLHFARRFGMPLHRVLQGVEPPPRRSRGGA